MSALPAPRPLRIRRANLRVVTPGELNQSPYPKASLLLRTGARMVDVAVAWGLFVVFGPGGGILSLVFLLLADGMFGGQSVGKRICGIKVVFLPSRAPARYRDSLVRNAPLALIVLLSMMPVPLGLGAFLGGVFVIGGIEARRVFKDPLGLRLGDVWAQTQVVDGKVVAGQGVLHAPLSAQRQPGRAMNAARSALP